MGNRKILIALAAAGIAVCSAGTGVMVVERGHPRDAGALPTVKPEDNSLNRPCQPGADERTSDLCAQWKAADAAYDAAWWAKFSGWFGGLGLVLTLGAVGVALHSNAIAQDTARRQLRAYIGVDAASILSMKAGEDGANRAIRVSIKNFGQTPALLEEATLSLVFKSDLSSLPQRSEKVALRNVSLNPGQTAAMVHPFSVNVDEHQALVWEMFHLMPHGSLRWRDIYGETGEAIFNYVSSGSTYETGNLKLHDPTLEPQRGARA